LAEISYFNLMLICSRTCFDIFFYIIISLARLFEPWMSISAPSSGWPKNLQISLLTPELFLIITEKLYLCVAWQLYVVLLTGIYINLAVKHFQRKTLFSVL
ncbi:hypothetical protein L9F63_021486, partial [Diploptera punctata]